MCDKQSPHLVTPHQRHESDHGDSTLLLLLNLKVESTLLVNGDYCTVCARESMKEGLGTGSA